MRIAKIFTFDAAHRLSNYEGKCRNLHGHHYLLRVTLEGDGLDKQGMVIDFGILKEIVNKVIDSFFDHKAILKKDDPINKKIAKAIPSKYNSCYLVNYNPTAENMVNDICTRLNLIFKGKFEVVKVRLYETPTSYAEVENVKR